MSLERIIREQVYKYKRSQYLKHNQSPAKSPILFSVFNAKSLQQAAPKSGRIKSFSPTRNIVGTVRKSSTRRGRRKNFYGSSLEVIGGRRIAGLICIILALLLICTQCFNQSMQKVKATEVTVEKVATQKDTAVEEISNNSRTLEGYYKDIQDFKISKKELKDLLSVSSKYNRSFSEVLALWTLEKPLGKPSKDIYSVIKKYDHKGLVQNYPWYEQGEKIYKQFIYDIEYFPIAKYEKYTYKASWKERTVFDEETEVYGIDILNPKNQAGEIPIVSMTDGIVEGLGWHDIGGYRIGVRSPGGAYFYYGHLDSLPTHIQKGDKVKAGDYLGLMGNSGYGIEGTKGTIPAKLHIGISASNKEGKAFWINPYPLLTYIEKHKASIK